MGGGGMRVMMIDDLEGELGLAPEMEGEEGGEGGERGGCG